MVYTHFVDTVPRIISVFSFRISWDKILLEDWKERCIHIL